MPATTERAIAPAPIAAVGGRVVASPFQFVTDDDDNLQIVSANSVTGIVVTLQGRRLDDKGQIVPFSYTHTPNADRTPKRETFKFGRGALLNLTVFTSVGAPLVGQCYVMVQLLKGFTGATIVLGTLLAGYVTATQALGFPGSPIVTSTEGEPAVRTIAGTTPAAGVNVSETVPTGARWELLGFRAALTTSAVAIARSTLLLYADPAGTLFQNTPSVDQPASTIYGYSWGPGLAPQGSAASAIVNAPTPVGYILRAGMTIQTFVGNLQAGDQWSVVFYQVREWLEVNT